MNIKEKKGFTLIELLIVIVIIGILAGIIIAVINPAEQNKRAREAVLRNTVGQICQAMSACIASQESPDAEDCDWFDEIGSVVPGEPENAVYWDVCATNDEACEQPATTDVGWVVNTPTDPDTGYVRYAAKDSGGCTIGCVVHNTFQPAEAFNGQGVLNSGVTTLLNTSGCSIDE